MKSLVVFGLCMLATPALADLKVGAAAPDFTLLATLGGKAFTFHLADALKKGPVVVYFYPAAFTKGCTVEAHDFAQAMPQFTAAGECQSKFPVAADRDRKVMKSYDATMFLLSYASRTSYVVGQDGKVKFAYSDMDPEGHVSGTLKAAQAIKAAR